MKIQSNYKREIESTVLNIVHEQHLDVSFYLHDVPDTSNDSFINAKELANKKAKRKENITGKPQEPDYSAANLIRLGAVQTMKKVPYVTVKRSGAKDYKSSLATDEHKKSFPSEWVKFKEENNDYFKNIRERRENIQPCENRPVQHQESVGQSAGYSGFNYEFTYTVG